jgi:hypothetical protein
LFSAEKTHARDDLRRFEALFGITRLRSAEEREKVSRKGAKLAKELKGKQVMASSFWGEMKM